MHAKLTVAILLTSALCAVAQGADLERGKTVFAEWCSGCHAATSARFGLPAGTQVLQQRYQGAKPAALEDRTDLPVAYIKTMVRNGLNVMPRTRRTEISDAELDDLCAYLTRNNR